MEGKTRKTRKSSAQKTGTTRRKKMRRRNDSYGSRSQRKGGWRKI